METKVAAEAFAALAQEHRLTVFRLLMCEGPSGMAAGSIADRLAMPPSTLSHHLAQLERAGLLRSRRMDRRIFYAVDIEGTRRLVDFLVEDCCQGHPEICGLRMGDAQPMTITIYHNPACGTSRNVLAMIRNSGEEPDVVRYLETPPSRETLVDLIARMGIEPRQLLRCKGTPYDALGLADPALTDDQLIDAMVRDPILIERPIVVTPLGVALCRPSEKVLDILPNVQGGAFAKEDGEVVVDADGNRVR